jgi:thioredoxin reductase (NADPH)
VCCSFSLIRKKSRERQLKLFPFHQNDGIILTEALNGCDTAFGEPISMATKVLDLLIVGAGPAGLGVAREAQKAKLSFLIVDRGAIGQSWLDMHEFNLLTPAKFSNLADLPMVSGVAFPTRREFVNYLYGYVKYFGLMAHMQRWTEIVGISKKRGIFHATAKNSRTGREFDIAAHKVAITTGTFGFPNLLGVPGEDNPNRVSHYFRTGVHHAGDHIAIIGSGNTAIEAAFQLIESDAASVTILNRGPELHFYSKTRNLNHIREFYESELQQRLREGLMGGIFTNPLRVENNCRVGNISSDSLVYDIEGVHHVVPCDYVYALTGYRFDTKLLKDAGARIGEDGLPLLVEKTLETTVEGLYAGGAVKKCFIHVYRDAGRRIVPHIRSCMRRSNGL